MEPAITAIFRFQISGYEFSINRRVSHKFVDQVKGEQYQPLTVLPDVSVNTNPGLVLLNKNEPTKWKVELQTTANKNIRFDKAQIGLVLDEKRLSVTDTSGVMMKNSRKTYSFELLSTSIGAKKLMRFRR